jgi:hypothetical protein
MNKMESSEDSKLDLDMVWDTVHSESIQTPWLFHNYTQYPIMTKQKTGLDISENVLQIKKYSTSQTFGHTYSFKVFSLFVLCSTFSNKIVKTSTMKKQVMESCSNQKVLNK